MQKHPSIKANATIGSCGFQSKKAVPVSRRAFQQFINLKSFHYEASPGVLVYELPCGCSVWEFQGGGGRFVSSSPSWLQ